MCIDRTWVLERSFWSSDFQLLHSNGGLYLCRVFFLPFEASEIFYAIAIEESLVIENLENSNTERLYLLSF